jgi:ABC-type amino acid transport substrate-binding protein
VVPGVELVYVRDYAVAFGHLKEGKVDAFPTDETVLRALIEQDAARDRGLRRGRKIFTAWFGPGSAMSMKRSFRIQPD